MTVKVKQWLMLAVDQLLMSGGLRQDTQFFQDRKDCFFKNLRLAYIAIKV